MKAIAQERYGEVDVLTLIDIDRPAVGDSEVLVRVRAAGVHYGDWHYMTGTPYLGRLVLGLRKPKLGVRGTDIAGLVAEVGSKVTAFKPGDEVFGWCKAGFAEYARASEDSLLPKPDGATFEQAAAVPTSGMTALQGLRLGRVRAGQRVLVIGAGGGVGTFAVQIAKALGAEVTGVCSTAKVELVRSIGADHVIDYTQQDPLRTGQPYDVIFDIAGNRPLAQLRPALTPDGTLVLVGGEGGGRWLGALRRGIAAGLRSPFTRQRMPMWVSLPRKEDLLELKGLVESGTVTPVVDRTYPLSQTPQAIRDLTERRARGKLVITI
jgi:NADPH:quinone reductase-like Zn-dependent oxidoreductase